MKKDGVKDSDIREAIALYLDSLGYEVTKTTYLVIDAKLRNYQEVA